MAPLISVSGLLACSIGQLSFHLSRGEKRGYWRGAHGVLWGLVGEVGIRHLPLNLAF